MARRAISQQFFDSLTAAFRTAPGAYARVARMCSCDPRTTQKAWTTGWPKLGLAPIREIVEKEKAALAAPPAAAQPVQEDPRRRKQKADEMIESGMQVITGRLLAQWDKISMYADALVEKVREAASSPVTDAAKAVALLNAVSRLGDRVIKMNETRIRAEVLRAGTAPPAAVVEEELDDMPLDDVVRFAKAWLATLEVDRATYGPDGDGAPAPLDTGARPWTAQQPRAFKTTCTCGATLVQSGADPDPAITLFQCPRCNSRYRTDGLHLYEDLDNAKPPVAQA